MAEKSVIITEEAFLDMVSNNLQRISDECPPTIPQGLKTEVMNMLMCLGAMLATDLFQTDK